MTIETERGQRRPGNRTPARPNAVTQPWAVWPREMLWLWRNPSKPEVLAAMRAAIADAVGALPRADIDSIADLADGGEPGAALRLIARRLHKCPINYQQQEDLAACALLLGTVEHQDERAALEFAVFASQRACEPREDRSRASAYPSPLDRPQRLHARLKQRVHLAVSLLATRSSGWGWAMRDVGSLAGSDPLGEFEAFGNPRSGWDL